MHIAIIGAGLMGRTLAWQLLRDTKNSEHKVELTLFDKDPIESGTAAAFTAAGMIAPYSEVEKGDQQVFEMGIVCRALWPSFVDSLQSDVNFSEQGTMVVAHKNDDAELQRFASQIKTKLGSRAKDSVFQLSQRELRKHSPDLTPQFNKAIYLKDEAFVDTKLFMQAIAVKLLDAGVTWHAKTEVTSIEHAEKNKNCPAHVTSKLGVESFDWVIDCRGLGAKKDIKDLRGVRGEAFRLHAPEVQLTHQVRLMHPRYCIYIVPRKNNMYFIGATQIESEDSGPVTVRSALELLSAAYSVHPGFAEARIISSESNCRPALKNNVPRIQINNNVMRINGLFRHGYLTAPFLAKEASQMILTNVTSDSPYIQTAG